MKGRKEAIPATPQRARGGAKPFRRILVPTDGSALSRAAIRRAVVLARQLDAAVVGLHVCPPYPGNSDPSADVAYDAARKRFRDAVHAAGRRHLAAVETAATAAHVRCEVMLAESARPYDAIVRAARSRHCDMIYMAAHGRVGMSLLMLGSQTGKVIAYSRVPVMVHC